MDSPANEVLVHSDGTTITLLDRGIDQEGEHLIVEHVVSKTGAMNGPHWHPILTESFTVKKGVIRFRIDGKEEIFTSGQQITVFPKQVHQFWNESEGQLVIVHEIRPPGNHWNMFKLIHKLSEKNGLTSKGIPRNPLWLGLAWESIDGYLAGPPVFLQRVLFGSLARLARAVGYRI